MAAPLTVNGQRTIPILWRERILKREFDVVLGKMLQPAQAAPDETEEPYLRSANIQWEGVHVFGGCGFEFPSSWDRLRMVPASRKSWMGIRTLRGRISSRQLNMRHG